MSLDIVNAFNTLPWQAIREALEYHEVPPYLRAVIGAYLRDRTVTYVGRNGMEMRREISCGVPQGIFEIRYPGLRRDAVGNVSGPELGMLRRNAHQRAMRKWRAQLMSMGCASQRVFGAVLPWVGRKGCATYRLTQILSGHGCFGEYLCRIGREETTRCHHCASDRDSAQHTLEDCPAWQSERRVLVDRIG